MNFCEPEMKKLYINEIFLSIQGEGSRAGQPCLFIRLQGCGLRCKWCDTGYALDLKTGGTWMTISEIREEIKKHDCEFIEFTGGEPLMQPDVIPFMNQLCDDGYTIAVETGGNRDVSELNPCIIKIIDFKCPGSGMEKHNNYANIAFLTQRDEVKFVLSDNEDYIWALNKIKEYDLNQKAGVVIFSPVFDTLQPCKLAKWMVEDLPPARMQLQMHKFIWDPEKRGV